MISQAMHTKNTDPIFARFAIDLFGAEHRRLVA